MTEPLKVGEHIIVLGWDIDLLYKGDRGVVTRTGLRNHTEPYVSAEFTIYADNGNSGTVRATPAATKVARCGCSGNWPSKQDRWAHADMHAAELKKLADRGL